VVRSRLSTFDSDSRRLVEALAVFDAAVAVEIAGQVASVPNPEQALRKPVDLGMVTQTVHGGVVTVSIPHRIQRDAVYVALSPTRRRELHRAAAVAVAGPSRWMHRVAAADSTEMTQVAGELETAADRWIADGDVDLGATLLLWGSELSDSRQSRERRLLTAMVHLLSARRTDRALPLLRPAAECVPSPLRDCVLGMASAWQGDRNNAERLLKGVMDATRGHADLQWIAREAAGVLASLYIWHGHGDAALRVQHEAVTMGHHASHLVNETEGNLLSARLLRDGPAAVVSHLDRLPPDRSDRSVGGPVQVGGYFLGWASICRILVGQLQAGRDDALTALSVEEYSRTSAFTGDLAYFGLTAAHYWMGDWEEADLAARRAISLAVAFEHPWAWIRSYALAAFVAASRGEWDRAIEWIGESAASVDRSGPAQYVLFPAMARAVLAQAQGDHPAMLRALAPVLELPGVNAWRDVYAPWWLPLHIEALISCSDLHSAQTALDRLRAGAGTKLPPTVIWLTGRLCEAHGDLTGAARHYQTAIINPAGCDRVPLQHARAEQDYARILALTGNDTQAMEYLRRAYRGFEALGAHPFLKSCQRLLVTALRQ
jgi:tetratricopeptide (TPR) repeat protein